MLSRPAVRRPSPIGHRRESMPTADRFMLSRQKPEGRVPLGVGPRKHGTPVRYVDTFGRETVTQPSRQRNQRLPEPDLLLEELPEAVE
jgi:hypothetical protein